MKKLLALFAAAVIAGAAQAEFISPGITVNGIKPTADGYYSGFEYKKGVFKLNGSADTYTLAGQDTSGKVRVIVAKHNCTVVLEDGFTLDLSKKSHDLEDHEPETYSPITLSTSISATIRANGKAELKGGDDGPGLRVVGGQKVYVETSGSSAQLTAIGGDGAAGIGSGHGDDPCGTIYLRGRVHAQGGFWACGIGQGSLNASGGKIYIDSDTADVTAVASYPAAAIGTSISSTGTMSIAISAGSVNAAQYNGGGAAIGTGMNASGTCNVTISGGHVRAAVYQDYNDEGSAGIGTGFYSPAEMKISIVGGWIQAYGGDCSAGIGGGKYACAPNISIYYGGTVFANGDSNYQGTKDIGPGRGAQSAGSVVMTGGSVCLANGRGTITAKDGTVLNCITVEGLAAFKDVNVSLETSKGTYGSDEIKSDGNGGIYLWVPPAKYNDFYVDGVRYTADASSGNAVATIWQPSPPTNDNFANATRLTRSSGRVVGKTIAATMESGMTLVVGSNTYNGDDDYSVWYSWPAPSSGRMRFNVECPFVDSQNLSVEVFTGSASQLHYPDGSSSTRRCTVEGDGFDGDCCEFTCTKGVTYKIRVSGMQHDFTLAWDSAEKAESFKASCDGRNGTAIITGYKGSGGAVTIPLEYFGCDVTAIGEGAFKDKNGITSVTISEGIKTIGKSAFRGCSLSSVTIPSSVAVISEKAFYECGNLKSVTVKEGVSVIGDDAFRACGALKTINLPSSIMSIGDSAFGLSGLTSIAIPHGVGSIGYGTFANCLSLASVTVPSSVKSIEYDAFVYCSALKAVTYLGNCPDVSDGEIYYGTSSSLVSYVPAGNITWADALAKGTWNGRAIRTGGAAYTVRYRKYDGSGETAEEDFDCGKTYTLAWLGSQLGWTRSGYEFCGWVPWNPDTKPRLCKYDNGQPVKDLAAAGETIDLYCGWKSSSSYRVCFHRCAGPDDLLKMNQVILRNKEDSLAWMDSMIGWKRDGYTFAGWDESEKATTVKYANGAKVKNLAMNGGTKHLYAVWRAKDDHKYPYTVKFFKYDGSGETRTQSFKAGTVQNLLWLESGLGWKRDGYEFVGWVPWNPDAKARLCKYVNGQKVVDLASKSGETVNLYAGWKSASSYRVCFHKNDGNDVKMNQVILRNKEDSLAWMDSMIGWQRDGYKFAGWAETEKGAVKYANGAKVKNLAMDGGTKHLYAVWKLAD